MFYTDGMFEMAPLFEPPFNPVWIINFITISIVVIGLTVLYYRIKYVYQGLYCKRT